MPQDAAHGIVVRGAGQAVAGGGVDHALAQGAKVIDVGTGAGFPGMPLLILRPDLQITFLDALNKRILFLEDALKRLGLTAATLHARAEDAAKMAAHREQYDAAVSRAVANAATLEALTLPFVKKGGVAIAWKGPGVADELTAARRAASVLAVLGVGISALILIRLVQVFVFVFCHKNFLSFPARGFARAASNRRFDASAFWDLIALPCRRRSSRRSTSILSEAGIRRRAKIHNIFIIHENLSYRNKNRLIRSISRFPRPFT